MRRITVVILSVVFFLSLIPTTIVIAQSRSVVWDRWDVLINQIDTTNNQFRVSENYDIEFNGTFRFGQRVIPYDNLEEIRNIEVLQDGRPLQSGCAEQPGTYCVRNVQEGVSIVYHFFSPITDATGSFTLSYTIVGALRVYTDGDQLWWVGVTEDKFGYPVRQSTIVVELPDEFAPREGIDPIETYGAPGDINVQGSLVTAIATRSISPDESFEIRVQYPHDPNARRASWQESFDQQRNFDETIKPILDIAFLVVGGLIAVFGPLAVFYLWYSRGRDPKIGPVPEYLTEPPSDLPPAIVGTLVDEKAELRDVLSTLIDLGNRGYLVIEEDRNEKVLGLFGGGSEFVFKRTDKELTDLKSFEKQFINKIFSGGKLERSLDSLKDKFYVHIPKLQEALYKDMVAQGLFKSNPDTTRKIWTTISVVVLAAAGGLGFLLFESIDSLGSAILCLPISLGIVGVSLLLTSSHMPAKTRKGTEEAAKWRAFIEYLTNLQKYSTIEETAPKFQEFLPYAVAFGLDRSWIRRFSNARDLNIPIPTWYYPRYYGGHYSRGYTAGTPLGRNLPSAQDLAPGEIASAGSSGGLNDLSSGLSGGLESISDGLTDMLNSASRTLNSRPNNTGGGSGSWSSGGSSWSGGGSFGGGGSGGGSSGFG